MLYGFFYVLVGLVLAFVAEHRHEGQGEELIVEDRPVHLLFIEGMIADVGLYGLAVGKDAFNHLFDFSLACARCS